MGDVFAQAHTGIEALAGDVDEAIVTANLDGHIRVLRQEILQHRTQDPVQRMVGSADADLARRGFTQVAQGGQFYLDFLEARADGLQQVFAGLGRRHAARGAGQQAQAESRLETANGVAERRLRHAEFGCGLGETAFTGDGEKGEQVGGVFPEH